MANLKRPTSVILILMGALFLISVFIRTADSPLFSIIRVVLACCIVATFTWGIIASVLRLQRDPKLNGIRRFRHLIILCIAAPFVYLILVEASDLISRRMAIYREAESKLQTSVTARSMLGQSLSTGWPITLSTEVSPEAGHAEMTIPVRGDHGKAELYVSGLKGNGVWTIKEMYIVQDGTKQHIQLDH